MKKHAFASSSAELLHFDQDVLRLSSTKEVKQAIDAALHQIQGNPTGSRPYPFRQQNIWYCRTLVVPQLIVAYRLERLIVPEYPDQKCWLIFPLLVRFAYDVVIDDPEAITPFTSVAVRLESRDHMPAERLSSALGRALDAIARLKSH